MRDLNEKESKIVELIRQSPKSFKELKQNGGNLLRSEATLDRTLKSLKNMNYIEDFPVSEPKTHIKKRYRLTEQFFDELEEYSKDQQLSRMIKSRLNWQNVFDKMRNFLEIEYPILFEYSDSIESKEIFSDVFSYLVFFNIGSDMLRGNSKKYFDLILYLILRHPDQKYFSIQNEFNFNPINFQGFIQKFKNEKKIEEFVFKKRNNEIREVYYLISDDPILYFIRQQIETYYFKFLLCWQFPGVYLEDHFDFIFHFSHKILDDLLLKIKGQKDQNLISFIRNNRICILTYIRRYILEFLDKIKLEIDDKEKEIEYPLELLPKEQKEKYISELVLTPEILTGVEKGYLEYHLEYLCLNPDNLSDYENFISTIIDRIEEIKDIEKRKNELVFLQSRLLVLLRIFYHQNKSLYESFKQKYNSNFNVKKLSYSNTSEELFNGIKGILPDMDTKVDDIKKKFIIRHLLERIDHLVNKIEKYPNDTDKYLNKILEIYEIASTYFSEKSQYPFLKKKFDLFIKGIDFVKEEEVLSILKNLNNVYPTNNEVLLMVFRYLEHTHNLNEVNKLIINNHWSLKDKIDLLERFSLNINDKFNLIKFFHLKAEDLHDLIRIKVEESSTLVIRLLKPIAFILERRGSIFDAFFIYYCACLLEQDIAFNPSERGNIFLNFPFYDFSITHFKIYAPSYLNLLRMNHEYSTSLFSSDKFKEKITTLIINSIHKIIPQNMDNYIESFPSLFKNFLSIAEFFQLESDFNEILDLISKGIEYDKHRTKTREFKTKLDISEEEKKILFKIKDSLKDFNKATKSFDFAVTLINIDKYFDDLNKKGIKNVVPQNVDTKDEISKIMDFQLKYGLNEFPDFAKNTITNLYSKYLPIGKDILKPLKFNFMFFNYINFLNNIQAKHKKSDFELLETVFTDKYGSKDYPFKIAFNRKYKVLKDKDLFFWQDIFDDLKEKEEEIIEVLDLYMYHTRLFFSFNELEKLAFIILRKYDIEKALNYVDTLLNYLFWFNARLKNPRMYVKPYNLKQELLFQILKFCFNTIKAKLFWEYRERSKAQEYVSLADENLKKIQRESQDLFGLENLIKFKEELVKLKLILLV